MFRILKTAILKGNRTERIAVAQDAELEQLGIELKNKVADRFQGSLAIRALDAGSCNGCELELHALNNAFYDVGRFGVHFVASPRHADVLLVTGIVSKHMQAALMRTWNAMPAPKYLVATGDCACNGGVFGESYASCGAVENVLPVDLKIAGCPPSPKQLIQGLLSLMAHQ